MKKDTLLNCRVAMRHTLQIIVLATYVELGCQPLSISVKVIALHLDLGFRSLHKEST